MEATQAPWAAYAAGVGEVFTIFHGDYGYQRKREQFKQVIRDCLRPYDVYPTFLATPHWDREADKYSRGGEPCIRFRVRAMDTGWKETLRRHNLSPEGK